MQSHSNFYKLYIRHPSWRLNTGFLVVTDRLVVKEPRSNFARCSFHTYGNYPNELHIFLNVCMLLIP
jgi:hypothetical protein